MDTSIAPAGTPDAPAPVDAAKPAVPGKSSKRWKAEIEQSREVRDKFVQNEWRTNVEYRRGKPFEKTSNEHRVSVPVDWSFTKSKEAGLFSQVPAVILVPKHERFKSAVPMMQKELNEVLTEQCKVGVAMEEALADKINASAIAGVICGYMATFRDVEIPDQDTSMLTPEQKQMAVEQGVVKMLPSKKRVDCKFYTTRLSASQLLWPKNFKGSDFDDADWVGYDGVWTWAQALREAGASPERPGGLTEAMKDQVCKSAKMPETLAPDGESAPEPVEGDELVSFTQIFYWAARQDPNELYLEKIHRIVFVDGRDEPIIDEPLAAQEWDEATESFRGVTKFPLRIGALTYISDMPVPPSDSEMGRPSVDEKMRSRSQMILQRDRSAPMRWANVNRVDPMIMQSLMKGDDYQRIIPVNGDGTTALGEVARANYPGEDWEFDKATDKTLMDTWQVGPNQVGGFNPAGRTAEEARTVQAGFATRQAKERAKVAKFFCGIAEVIMGYMQMFYEGPKESAVLGEDGVTRMNTAWDRKTMSAAKFVCTIREDSSVKLDSGQQLEQQIKILNILGKSGVLNVPHIAEQIITLSGGDPAKAIMPPKTPKAEPPNVSFRAGGEDLRDPIIGPFLIAVFQKSPNAVTPEEVEAAKQLLIASSSPVTPPAGPTDPLQPGPARPTLPPQPPEDYGPMPRITKRQDEFGG